MEKNIFCINCGQVLPVEAKFCFSCGQRVETGGYQDAAEGLPENMPSQQESMDIQKENDIKLTLVEFREQAASQTGFRDQLLTYRKSLSNNWDYNAFVGILLGVRGPKHGDAACMNFAIGQGDNGNNTKKTLEAKGLMPIFEKYKGKKISSSILLSDVEDEIVSAVPDFGEIRKKFHEIVFAEAGGNGGEAALPHKSAGSASPAAEAVKEIPHAEPAAAETEDISETINTFVEILASRVLEYVTGDKNISRIDWAYIKENYVEWSSKLDKNQQDFEAYFGTSPEARWLYSAKSIMERSICFVHLYEDDPRYFHRAGYEIDEAVALLQELPEGKYGIAYYALAKCYGVGIDTLISGERVYVLRPDFVKLNEYLVKAVKAQRSEKEALMDLGCIELSRYNYLRAKQIFEMAEKLGDQKAAIYLRYIECCERAVPAINGQQIIPGDRQRNGQQIYGNIVEYKGRIYWMCRDRQYKTSDRPILLCSTGPEGKRTVLAKIEHPFGTSDFSAADEGLSFSICDDLIYYENGSEGICTMRLDGSDKRELTNLSDTGKASVRMPMAFPGFLLYVRSRTHQLFKLEQNGVKTMVRSLNGRRPIVGVSEREINIANEELIDLRTLEKRKVTEKYPALKKKTVFYIDMAREIAYYAENTDTEITKDMRLIGVNTQGEIVDYWEMPSMPYNYKISTSGGSISLCFNGQRLSVKTEIAEAAMKQTMGQIFLSSERYIEKYMELWKKQGLSELEWPFVALFDRRGNRQLLREIKTADDYASTFGGLHMMTENGVVVLKCYKGGEWWNTYYPAAPKGDIPPAKLDFFTG